MNDLKGGSLTHYPDERFECDIQVLQSGRGRGAWGTTGERDGVTVKDGGRVWNRGTNERRSSGTGTNYFQGTDVNTPRAWCSHDADMNMHIKHLDNGTVQKSDSSEEWQKSARGSDWMFQCSQKLKRLGFNSTEQTSTFKENSLFSGIDKRKTPLLF